MTKLKVKYFSDVYTKEGLKYTGDWVDVRACHDAFIYVPERDNWYKAIPVEDEKGRLYIDIFAGTLYKISLGIGVKLPEGYEAILKVRSSTSKNTGLLFASSGVIDESYCGNNDEWFGVYYATRRAKVYIGERISQFRIQKKQPNIDIEVVENLDDLNRGGHGSTGRF